MIEDLKAKEEENEKYENNTKEAYDINRFEIPEGNFLYDNYKYS